MGGQHDQKEYIEFIHLHLATERKHSDTWTVRYGLSPKYVDLRYYEYTERVANIDTDNWLDEVYEEQSGNVDLDIGISADYKENIKLGLVARNVIGSDVDDREGQTHELKPSLTAGIGYQVNGFTITTDIDLIKETSFETLIPDRQWARVGAEYDLKRWIQLGVGVRHDLEGNYQDILTAGVGLSPFDILTIDVVGMVGDDDALGGAIQIGLKL
ncbi:conjugal transfer protein TraF [Vibrio sp.]|nr:conjugal transfer protein TraF [Vibrio sp.]